MNAVGAREPTLTDEQRCVATASSDQLTLVQAGAGTGKTHTLIARLAFLAEEAGLDPGDDLLVLSFSRAAVSEVRKRLASHPSSLPYVPIQTFDSFATSLLDEVDPDGAWTTAGYDARIRAADKLFDHDTSGLRDFLTVRHLLIDEAQDLVDDRARFVLSLLTFTGAAFTVFTDAAQAIYGFHSTSVGGADRQPDFAVRLAQLALARPVITLALTTQHRAGSPATTRVMALGAKLADPSADSQAIAHELHDLVETLPPVESLLSIKRLLDRATPRTTAVLCRTNAQALALAGELGDMGIACRMQRQAADRAIGSWLARAAQGIDAHLLSHARFVELTDGLSDLPPIPKEALWLCLRRMDPRSRTEIDLRRVAARLRCDDVPEEMNHVVPSNIVVSTIHRSKGLEFDRVVLAPMTLDDEDAAEANRVLYVGLSRARDEIFILPNVRPKDLRSDSRLGRVVRGGFARGRQPVSGIEITSFDTSTARPAGVDLDGDAVATQDYLQEHVRPGDPVSLILAARRRDPNDPPRYQAIHEGIPIAETSEHFGTVLASLLPAGGQRRWPTAIEGVRVQMVDTVAGDETIARNLGISRCGMWARARLQGVGQFSSHREGSQ